MLNRIAFAYAVLATIIASVMAVNSNYEGSYKLTQLYDSETGEVPIPKEFVVRFRPGPAANRYQVGFKIGNSMGGTVIVSESSEDSRDAVKVGPVRSTMMMPAADVYEVEKALTKMLPDMEFIRLENSDDLLVMEGPKGSMRCARLT